MKLTKTLIITILLMFFSFTCTITNAKSNTSKSNENNKYIEYLNLSWWNEYNDSILSQYILELFEKNQDLKIAALKVKEGEKLVKLSFANELPQLSFNGDFGRIMPSSDQQFGNMVIPSFSQYQFQIPLTASYEIDIWGSNRLKTKSLQKQLEIIKQEERASYITLTYYFATDYFNLIKTDKLIELQKRIIEIQEIITQKTKTKYSNGLCTINEVLNEEKFLNLQKEALNNLEHTQTILINQLRVFLSDNYKNLDRSSYEELSLISNIPTEIDSQIISNRPDYIQAEESIKQAGYNVKVAKREFLPKFTIYGQLGFNAYEWGKLFNTSSQLANAGILPAIDLFSGGRKLAFLKLKKFEYDEAVTNYQKTILTSIQEVNDSCAKVKTDYKNYEQSLERVKLDNKKYELLSYKNKIGAAANLDVLYLEQQKLLTQCDEVSNKINYLISTIGLYKAIGGKNLHTITQNNEQQEKL